MEPLQPDVHLVAHPVGQASPSAQAAYRLTQAFMHMIREHAGQQLETWLSLVEESTLPEFQSFAKGIQQDKAAVLAGLTLPWSNGPLEGHINRLKLIKRIVSWGFSFSVAETGLKRLQNNVH